MPTRAAPARALLSLKLKKKRDCLQSRDLEVMNTFESLVVLNSEQWCPFKH